MHAPMTAPPPVCPPHAADSDVAKGAQALPPPQRTDRLAALTRDPHTLVVYWALNGPLGQAALASAGRRAGRWLLRLTDLTGTRHIRIDVHAGKQYVPVNSNASCHIAIGFACSDGFFPVLESAPVATPRAMPSMQATVKWAKPKARESAPKPAAPEPKPRPMHIEAYLRAIETAYGFPVASGS